MKRRMIVMLSIGSLGFVFLFAFNSSINWRFSDERSNRPNKNEHFAALQVYPYGEAILRSKKTLSFVVTNGFAVRDGKIIQTAELTDYVNAYLKQMADPERPPEVVLIGATSAKMKEMISVIEACRRSNATVVWVGTQ